MDALRLAIYVKTTPDLQRVKIIQCLEQFASDDKLVEWVDSQIKSGHAIFADFSPKIICNCGGELIILPNDLKVAANYDYIGNAPFRMRLPESQEYSFIRNFRFGFISRENFSPIELELLKADRYCTDSHFLTRDGDPSEIPTRVWYYFPDGDKIRTKIINLKGFLSHIAGQV